jgi:hypothetical protein
MKEKSFKLFSWVVTLIVFAYFTGMLIFLLAQGVDYHFLVYKDKVQYVYQMDKSITFLDEVGNVELEYSDGICIKDGSIKIRGMYYWCSDEFIVSGYVLSISFDGVTKKFYDEKLDAVLTQGQQYWEENKPKIDALLEAEKKYNELQDQLD